MSGQIQDITSLVESILRDLEPQRVFAELEFINVTPLWPGGPINAQTLAYIDIPRIFLPSTQQIIGRLRWLIRTVEASIKINANTYKDVDELNRRFFGDLSRSGTIIVRASYSVDNQKALYIDPGSLKKILEKSKQIPGEHKEKLNELIDSLEVKGYTVIRKGLGLDSDPKLSKELYSTYGEIIDSIDQEALKLFTIPRFRLSVQGVKSIDDIYLRQPLKPGSVTLKVEIGIAAGRNVSQDEKDFITLATVFMLTFIGLGKATTRGFGKFRLKKGFKGSFSNRCKDLLSLARENDEKECRKCKETFEEIGRELIELASRILNVGGVNTHSLVESSTPGRVPRLSVAIRYVKDIQGVKHPCPYASRELAWVNNNVRVLTDKRQVRDVLEALSAIGKATMKSTWKVLHRRLRASGVSYQTWALGLPRGAKAEKSKHGYHDSMDIEIRRLSPIFFTPYYSGDSWNLLVIPFFTVDDFLSRIKRMVHVGVHRGKGRGTSIQKLETLLKQGIIKYDNTSDPCSDVDRDCIEKVLNITLDWIVKLLG